MWMWAVRCFSVGEVEERMRILQAFLYEKTCGRWSNWMNAWVASRLSDLGRRSISLNQHAIREAAIR